jgi:hypothetical protein
MKIYLASILVVAACTDGSSETSTPATDIAYDNSTTGLMSSNVQDALDDIAAMSSHMNQQLDKLTIVCTFETSSLSLPAYTPKPHVFTALECGGALPDANYVGTFAKLRTCAPSFYEMSVMNTGEPDGPGVVLRTNTSCSDTAKIVVVFHKTT